MIKTDLINWAKEKAKAGECYSNEILYDMCKKRGLSDTEALAAEMLIIGRVYAASPQRRSYGTSKTVEDKGKKVTLHSPASFNNGQDDFFTLLAKTMQDQDGFNTFLNDLKDLKSENYTFDLQKDKRILEKSIQLVSNFNEMLRTSIEIIDGVDKLKTDKNGNYLSNITGEPLSRMNHVSFSSKFMHFNCPDIIFIIDQFARDGGTKLCSSRVRKDAVLDRTITITKKDRLLDKEMESWIKELTNNYNIVNMDDTLASDEAKLSDYIKHSVRSYFLAKVLFENGIQDGINPFHYPRITDSIFLNVKEKDA